MKKFTYDVVESSYFEFCCSEYFELVSKYRSALKSENIFLYTDLLCDIGSFTHRIASSVVKTYISVDENNYLIKRAYSLKFRIEKKLTLK